MQRLPLIWATVCIAATCFAQDVRVPTSVVAGNETSIATTGSGQGTFYLLGPGISRKSTVNLGEEIRLSADEVQHAGSYRAIVCSETCRSSTFFVTAAKPLSLTFLVHPSRVPVGLPDAVSGVALPFDQFHNLVLTPLTLNFQLTSGKTTLLSRPAGTQDGVAWFRTTSGKSAGALQVVAALDNVSARRVVQEVASDPCNLRITGQRTPTGIVVQTEPVHDCAGNAVPDGTIVTFTASDGRGKSTVDAPIKQGIARAQVAGSGTTVISAASGIVLGNELRIEAQP